VKGSAEIRRTQQQQQQQQQQPCVFVCFFFFFFFFFSSSFVEPRHDESDGGRIDSHRFSVPMMPLCGGCSRTPDLQIGSGQDNTSAAMCNASS